MKFLVFKFTHNSVLMDDESPWSEVERTKLPRKAFADQGEEDKKSTWKYPHHWVVGGSDLDDSGVYTDGKLYLHSGGLKAAWAAANGARSGQTASQGVFDVLKSHRETLGIKDDVYAIKADEEHQVVYGVVYAPNRVDTDWEAMTAEEIQKMAWNFLENHREENIDLAHDLKQSGCVVVESFVARSGDPDFPEGAWVLGTRCPDDVWKRIKEGEFNGYSFYGGVKKYPATVLLEVAKQITGITEKSTIEILPVHEHTFIVNLNNKAQIVSGRTDVVLNHSHAIKKGTATELEIDHNHRVFLE